MRNQLTCALAVMTLAAGCNGKPGPAGVEGPDGNETVRGKVTYNGEPVTYGFVLFFNHASFDPMTGSRRPVAFGTIGPDGAYEVSHAPTGPVQVCVATNPDADPISFAQPTSAGGAPPTGPPGQQGMRPGGAAPPGGPMPMSPPGGPGQLPPGAPPVEGKVARKPDGVEAPPAMPPASPAAMFSAARRKLLKQIHDQFGIPERPRLSYVVKEGEQTFNIVLK